MPAVDPDRSTFYRDRFPEFWADIGDQPYALFDVHPMGAGEIDGVRRAATDAWHIITRIGPIMRALSDEELGSIGIPAAALHVCRLFDPAVGESSIVRFDFALTDDGPKVLEVNAETPMFLWESYEIAGATARAFGFADPNEHAIQQLGAAIARGVGGDPNARVAVTAYNTWREDWFGAIFAARIAANALSRPVDVIPLHELRIADGALRDARGAAIDVLWRMYPLEHFAADRNGPRLFELVERGLLRLINPPSALLVQNKAVLAVIWEFGQRQVWFEGYERDIIVRCFLPTYIEQPTDDKVYVRKPVFGREGNSVSIVRGSQTLAASAGRNYGAQPSVYQEYVRLPNVCEGKAIVTCFVVDGVASAIAMRVGAEITDAHAKFVSIGVANDLVPPQQFSMIGVDTRSGSLESVALENMLRGDVIDGGPRENDSQG